MSFALQVIRFAPAEGAVQLVDITDPDKAADGWLCMFNILNATHTFDVMKEPYQHIYNPKYIMTMLESLFARFGKVVPSELEHKVIDNVNLQSESIAVELDGMTVELVANVSVEPTTESSEVYAKYAEQKKMYDAALAGDGKEAMKLCLMVDGLTLEGIPVEG